MLNPVSTGFISRLRARDPAAWFELWQTFGPILRNQFRRWGKGHLGFETIQDLSQETLAALANAIDRHDPDRGARFSTWLLAIAKHTLGDEIDRRMAQKRGSGKKPAQLDEAWMGESTDGSPSADYERAVFGAKIEAAIRMVESETEFMDFSAWRMRVLDGLPGRQVAEALGVSEPTVSRRTARVRNLLRERLTEVMCKYSFTDDELQEAARNGIDPNPKKASDALFDEALAETYRRHMESRDGT